MSCVLCGGKLEVFYHPETNVSVSSDCKVVNSFPDVCVCAGCGHVQKQLNAKYIEDTDTVYANYSAYSLTGGEEQLQFVDEVSSSRSKTIIHNILDIPQVKTAENWLDLGTGSGVMLQSISRIRPDLVLWGQDVSAHNSQGILEIDGVQGFFEGDSLFSTKQKFDVISVNHVLEHVREPIEFVEQTVELLSDDGVLVIQVPDILTNPFDLCVFDHVSHFQSWHLLELLSRFYEYVLLPEKQIYKEITILASKKEMGMQTDLSDLNVELLNIDPLRSLNSVLLATCGPAAVFSTGPIGLYAGACLGGNLCNFVDEDALKIGKEYLGVKIISPSDVSDCRIINPQPLANRRRIETRHPSLNFVEY